MKRKHLYVILCVVSILVLSLSIAYATLSQTLTISGSADVVASTWDVHFENEEFVSTISNDNLYDYKVQPLALVHETCDISQNDCVEIISDTEFLFGTRNVSNPGDAKGVKFDVVNSGSIDAKLNNYTLTGLSTEQDVYLNYYVIHADGTQLATNELLKAGERTSMKLILEFDPNVTGSQLPTSKQELNLSFKMNYTQAD